MARNNRNHTEGSSEGTRRKMSLGKKIGITLLTSAGIAGVIGGVDMGISKHRKSDDFEKYGKMEVQKDSTGTPESIVHMHPTLDTDGENNLDESILNIEFEDIITHNQGLLRNGFSENNLTSIITGEDELKTKHKIGQLVQRVDNNYIFEKHGIERSTHSKSIVGKILSIASTGSYGPFQVQREAIDKYKSDEDLYNKICNDIAVFKLPNNEGKWEELYIQLGYNGKEEMIKDIREHKIDMYKGGGRVGIAYGVVLINEIYKECNEPIEKFDMEKGYNIIESNVGLVEKNDAYLKEAVAKGNKDHTFRNQLVTGYSFSRNGNVNFDYIVNIYQSPEFQNGASSALWCTDNIKSNKNCNYLYALQLKELNQYFEDNKFNESKSGELDIKVPTGNFGKTSIKLTNKYFNTNFDPDKNQQKALDFLSKQNMNNMCEGETKQYIQNLRRLFELGSNEKDNSTWTKVNSKHEIFLQESFDLTFNHSLVCVEVLKKFTGDNIRNGKEEKLKQIDDMFNHYVNNQDKDGIYINQLKQIITNKEKFKEFTGLGDQKYMEFLKGYLLPALIGNTVLVSETHLIIPEIQGIKGGTWKGNEQNSLARFDIGMTTEQQNKLKLERGVSHVVHFNERMLNEDDVIEHPEDKTLEIAPSNMGYLKDALFNNGTVRQYLELHCVTQEGEKIDSTNIASIPDELVYLIVRDENGECFEDINTIKEGDKIYFKTINLETIHNYFDNLGSAFKKETKRVRQGKKWIDKEINIKICVDNGNGTYTVQKGARLQDIVSYYYKNNDKIKKEIDRLNGGNPVIPGKIPAQMMKKLVRDKNGNEIDVNNIREGQVIRFGIQLNNL